MIKNTFYNESLIIEKSKDDNFTLKTTNIYLHSKYSPKKESDKIANNFKEKKLNTVILLGFGLGYKFESFKLLFPNIKIIGIDFSREFGLRRRNHHIQTGDNRH